MTYADGQCGQTDSLPGRCRVAREAGRELAWAIMAADVRATPDPGVTASLEPSRVSVRGRSLLGFLTSIPCLALALMGTIAAAAGGLQGVDELLDRRWLLELAPQSLPFVQGVLDRIAGQAVCLPILAAVAIVLAIRRRSWHPVAFAALTELAFLVGVGGLKILTARPSPLLDEPDMLRGGALEFGEMGISFPSGHAAEAVLIYGAAAYLIARYSRASKRTVNILWGLVAVITVNSAVVSVLLGWHWVSDVVGGVIAGALFLRILVWWDTRADRATPVATV